MNKTAIAGMDKPAACTKINHRTYTVNHVAGGERNQLRPVFSNLQKVNWHLSIWLIIAPTSVESEFFYKVILP